MCFIKYCNRRKTIGNSSHLDDVEFLKYVCEICKRVTKRRHWFGLDYFADRGHELRKICNHPKWMVFYIVSRLQE